MKLFSEKHTTPDGIDISFQALAAGNVEVLYQGKWGSVDP